MTFWLALALPVESVSSAEARFATGIYLLPGACGFHWEGRSVQVQLPSGHGAEQKHSRKRAAGSFLDAVSCLIALL